MELNPLRQIDPVVIGSAVAIFTVTHFVLRKTFFLPVIEVMERRRDRIETAAAQREEAAALSRTAAAGSQDIRARGDERAERVSQAVRERAQSLRTRRLETARAETAASIEAGRRDIAREREAELATLRAETATCVSLACDRLLGHVDTHTVDAVVGRLVERRIH